MLKVSQWSTAKSDGLYPESDYCTLVQDVGLSQNVVWTAGDLADPLALHHQGNVELLVPPTHSR